ncbi:MAG: hypothetical protein AAFY11_12825 [Cyanobacteria bacterium J06641_5]
MQSITNLDELQNTIDPLFWLTLSGVLVALSLTAVLVAALPVLQEVARAARSAEKLCDTLQRDFPPALEALRLASLEVNELTDDMNDGIKSASDVARQVNRSVDTVRDRAAGVRRGTRGIMAGVRAAWSVWQRSGADLASVNGAVEPPTSPVRDSEHVEERT